MGYSEEHDIFMKLLTFQMCKYSDRAEMGECWIPFEGFLDYSEQLSSILYGLI